MRACQVHSGNLYGGVETFFVTLARHHHLGPETHFALCFEGRLSAELAAAGATVHSLGRVRARLPWTVWRARRRLGQLIRREQYDVVVCNASWAQAIFGPVVRACGKPLVFWLHGPITRRSLLDSWAKRTVPDLVVGVSRHTAESSRLLYPAVPTAVLHYPMPWPESAFDGVDRAAVRAELNTPADATVLIQASRMEAWKGHPDLLRALARLRDLPGWCCWQVGGAQRPQEVSYLAEVRGLAAELGLGDRVRFLGQRSDVPRLLGAADLLCQANRGPEGFSLAFMEAFSAGLPIVTTALGGAPELIDETCGALVAPGDVAGLADALRGLILSPERRKQMRENARRRVRELCDPAQQLTRLQALLERVTPAVTTGAAPAV
jgi:glycosyltransferase involved in cell wall biosynthesis